MKKSRGLKDAARDPLVQKEKRHVEVAPGRRASKRRLVPMVFSFALGLVIGLLTRRFVRLF